MLYRNELPIVDIEKRKKGGVFLNYLSIVLVITLIYPFTPFNFFAGHEIYPWYVILLIFIYHKGVEIPFYFIFFFLISLVLYGLFEIGLLEKVVVFDLIQVGVVFVSLYYFNKFSTLYLLKIDRILINGLKAVVLLMVFQKIFPQYFNWISDILIFRESAMAVDHRSGGVKGVAPEPAYMAAVIISIYLYSWWVNIKIETSVILFSSLGVLLTGSLSGMLMFSFVIFISLSSRQYFKNNKHLIFIIMTIMVISTFAVIYSSQALDRFLIFIGTLLELLSNGGIKEMFKVGELYGSTRGISLIEPLTNICCSVILTDDAYAKSYSLLGVLNTLFSPISWMLLFYYLIRKKLTRIRLCSLFLMTFYGPVLIVLLYVGLLPKRRVARYD
jgi:hypothetical protein